MSRLLVGRKVDLRVTGSKAGVFPGGGRVATHPPFPPYARNRHPAAEADMPDGKSYSDWDAGRIRRWADRVGPSCREVVDRAFASHGCDGQAFNACPSVLRLSGKYGAGRLEGACPAAPAAGKRSPRRRDVEPVLRPDRDKVAEALSDRDGAEGPDAAGYVRGASSCGEGQTWMRAPRPPASSGRRGPPSSPRRCPPRTTRCARG